MTLSSTERAEGRFSSPMGPGPSLLCDALRGVRMLPQAEQTSRSRTLWEFYAHLPGARLYSNSSCLSRPSTRKKTSRSASTCIR